MTTFGVYRSVKTAWRRSGKGRDVILLHGWGQNMQMMSAIESHLNQFFCVYNLDFPGFGESDDPMEPWGVPEYVEFLEDFVTQNQISNPILIAHSFGCRAAIRYAALHHDVTKMCLTGAAGIRPKHGLDYEIKTKAYKVGKWLLKASGNTEKLEELQKNAGSEDYKNAHGVMRATFVKVVNDDVTELLKDVLCPVLLVWGDQDTAVPLWMGKEMEKAMPDAGLAIFAGDDHWAYWHQSERFNLVLDAFLKEDEQC
ncbi:MAG: alpha/beta hydrolase [Erysipelotrichia bacterium]|nr:alpha/beta hydrolase [Erysipelotrichia bacterium]